MEGAASLAWGKRGRGGGRREEEEREVGELLQGGEGGMKEEEGETHLLYVWPHAGDVHHHSCGLVWS